MVSDKDLISLVTEASKRKSGMRETPTTGFLVTDLAGIRLRNAGSWFSHGNEDEVVETMERVRADLVDAKGGLRHWFGSHARCQDFEREYTGVINQYNAAASTYQQAGMNVELIDPKSVGL